MKIHSARYPYTRESLLEIFLNNFRYSLGKRINITLNS